MVSTRKYVDLMKKILTSLERIEKKENVQILYACESGSRAWGFPSSDSDYDVRFLYVRPKDWYLTIDIEEKRDVIERPLKNNIDISGWDLRKALKLLRKSNPSLLEWLHSPIIYKQNVKIVSKIQELAHKFYSPKSCQDHYLHMAQGNYRKYLKEDKVWVKKYFYVLRPLLAIRWIEKERTVVPMEFGRLVNSCINSSKIRRAIEVLLERKKKGHELDCEPRINVISEFIENEIKRLQTNLPSYETKKSLSGDSLNKFFQTILDRAYY